jgi:hypothetical protein
MTRFLGFATLFVVAAGIVGLGKADDGCAGSTPQKTPCIDSGAKTYCWIEPGDPTQASTAVCQARYRFKPDNVAQSCVTATSSHKCSLAFQWGPLGVMPLTTKCGTRTTCYLGISPDNGRPACLESVTTYDTQTTYYEAKCNFVGSPPGGGGVE